MYWIALVRDIVCQVYINQTIVKTSLIRGRFIWSHIVCACVCVCACARVCESARVCERVICVLYSAVRLHI